MNKWFIALACAGMIATAMATGAEQVLAPPRHGGVYVVAHRGAHEGIPENTLAAYRKAIELGADFVEIDVRTTKDGKFVSVHNSNVDSYVKDVKGAVKDFTLAELKGMDIGSRVGPEWKDERIPTFEEILELCKGKIGIYLDLKEAPVEALVPIIKAHGMEKSIIWYASYDELKQLQDVCADCIPMPDPGEEKHLAALLKEKKPKLVASTWEYFSQEYLRACHDAGAIVIVDEDGTECWKPMLEWGTDGIQTDHPAALIALLDARIKAQ